MLLLANFWLMCSKVIRIYGRINSHEWRESAQMILQSNMLKTIWGDECFKALFTFSLFSDFLPHSLTLSSKVTATWKSPLPSVNLCDSLGVCVCVCVCESHPGLTDHLLLRVFLDDGFLHHRWEDEGKLTERKPAEEMWKVNNPEKMFSSVSKIYISL